MGSYPQVSCCSGCVGTTRADGRRTSTRRPVDRLRPNDSRVRTERTVVRTMGLSGSRGESRWATQEGMQSQATPGARRPVLCCDLVPNAFIKQTLTEMLIATAGYSSLSLQLSQAPRCRLSTRRTTRFVPARLGVKTVLRGSKKAPETSTTRRE